MDGSGGRHAFGVTMCHRFSVRGRGGGGVIEATGEDKGDIAALRKLDGVLERALLSLVLSNTLIGQHWTLRPDFGLDD